MKLTHRVAAVLLYSALLLLFWVEVHRQPLPLELAAHLTSTFVSFSLLLAPLWFFGFGLGNSLHKHIEWPSIRVLLPALLVVPYLLFALPSGNFHWQAAVLMLAMPLGLAALLDWSHSNQQLGWPDILVLVAVAAVHLFRVLEPAWQYVELTVLPKLLLTDLVLYLYTVVRPVPGIGYSLIPTSGAVKSGLWEFVYFLPLGTGLGALLHFTHFHPRLPAGESLVAGVILTFLFVSVPEEFFFRGVLQNLLETRLGYRLSLVTSAIAFGFSHYHRGGKFDWRYILLATIAGIFYGRAWRRERQLLSSVITHTAVDVVWSVWLR